MLVTSDPVLMEAPSTSTELIILIALALVIATILGGAISSNCGRYQLHVPLQFQTILRWILFSSDCEQSAIGEMPIIREIIIILRITWLVIFSNFLIRNQ
jgi:hypothetical protein